MAEDVKIVETRSVSLKDSVVVEGFPDVGLAGTLAASYLVEQLKLDEVGHVESKLFPPVMVLHKGVISDPFRIFAKDNLVVITSEIAVPPSSVHQLSEEIAAWVQRIGAKLLVSLSGIPVPNRMEITDPKVFGAGNREDALQMLKVKGINVMEEGFVAGIYALLMKECLKRWIPAAVLLAESFPTYPDPWAAASTINSLNSLLGFNVDVKPLLEKADDLRVKLRDLMRQAKGSMNGMKKGIENEIPAMYQ